MKSAHFPDPPHLAGHCPGLYAGPGVTLDFPGSPCPGFARGTSRANLNKNRLSQFGRKPLFLPTPQVARSLLLNRPWPQPKAWGGTSELARPRLNGRQKYAARTSIGSKMDKSRITGIFQKIIQTHSEVPSTTAFHALMTARVLQEDMNALPHSACEGCVATIAQRRASCGLRAK